jgi:hypothetical protein
MVKFTYNMQSDKKFNEDKTEDIAHSYTYVQ